MKREEWLASTKWAGLRGELDTLGVVPGVFIADQNNTSSVPRYHGSLRQTVDHYGSFCGKSFACRTVIKDGVPGMWIWRIR